MIEFNDYHIFAGEIKQILANFCLPKYRDGKWQKTDEPTYFFGEDLKNWTRKLKIRTNAYDSYTHEYLGWYLRFIRDKRGIDLMPLYNCFSDSACKHLDLKAGGVAFDSSDQNYKIYSLPVMLGKKYTIAIDSAKPVEICCAIYDAYQADDQLGVPTATYERRAMTSFGSPFIYDTAKAASVSGIGEYEADVRMILKIDAGVKSSIVILEGDYRGWNDTTMRKRATTTKKGNPTFVWETTSNHWVTNYESTELSIGQAVRYLDPIETAEFEVKADDATSTITAPVQRTDDVAASNTKYVVPLEDACANFKPITPLQLLRLNSGVSHPFADRLIEYLTGNAITDDDEIADDIRRVQQTMSFAVTGGDLAMDSVTFREDGVWEDKMRPMLYDAMQVDRYNGNDKNHDVLGYVDKDVETYYRTVEWKGNHENDDDGIALDGEWHKLKDWDEYTLHYGDWDQLKYAYYRVHTIAGEDIYPDMYKADKRDEMRKAA